MPNDELGVFEPVTYFSATFAAALVFANPIYLFVLAPIEYVHVDLSKNVEAICVAMASLEKYRNGL